MFATACLTVLINEYFFRFTRDKNDCQPRGNVWKTRWNEIKRMLLCQFRVCGFVTRIIIMSDGNPAGGEDVHRHMTVEQKLLISLHLIVNVHLFVTPWLLVVCIVEWMKNEGLFCSTSLNRNCILSGSGVPLFGWVASHLFNGILLHGCRFLLPFTIIVFFIVFYKKV